MKQGTIDFDNIPLSRSSDPKSSREAERLVVESGTKERHEDRIVAAVRERPGMTGDEIAAALGLTNVQVLRRTAALERQNRIRRGDQRASRLTGRLGVTWWPVEGST